jgi:hypothetical protein
MTAPQTPLLIAGQNNNRRIAVLGFDLHDTDLPLQPAFPILIYNMINWFLPPPVGGDGQVAPGTPVTVQTWPGADKVTITTPDQHVVTVGPPFPVAPFDQTNTVGLYQVTQRIHGQERLGAFTVNLFDPIQSRLTPATELPVIHSTNFTIDNNTVPRELREIWPWIAAFLLLVLCIEWWLFSRSYRQFHVVPDQHQGTALLRAGRLQPQRPTSRLEILQDQLEERYKTTMKRVTKATKRLRSRLISRK